MNKLEDAIQFSINRGLLWLSKNQNDDGSFGDLYPVTSTALAIFAYEKHAQKNCTSPLNDLYMFHTNVDKAFKFLFNSANVDEHGVYFEDYGNINMPTGAVLATLGVSECEDYLIAFDEYLPINGYTFNQLKSEIISYLTWSQNDNGGYSDSKNNPDSQSSNIITGYPLLGLIVEKCYGCGIPKSIFTKLQDWVTYIQNENGGAGNHSPNDNLTILSTGILIQEMFFLDYLCNNNSLKWAKQFIADNWYKPAGPLSPGWNNYPVADYQATFALTLGLSLFDVDYIKSSNSTCIYWHRDITRVVMGQQNQDGSWPASKISFDQSDQELSTIWAILTLEYIIASCV